MILLLQRGVHPYEYMDNWEIFNETMLTERKAFYSNLNKDDITDVGYVHAKRVCKDFEITNLEYHDLYVQSDTLLLADVLRTSEILILIYVNLILQKFFQFQD